MDLKYTIWALKSNSYFCYSLFSKWCSCETFRHFWPREHICWDRSMKFWEIEGDIKVNKPKEGFLNQTSFLAMQRTVYFFTSLTRWLRMFPCFIRRSDFGGGVFRETFFSYFNRFCCNCDKRIQCKGGSQVSTISRFWDTGDFSIFQNHGFHIFGGKVPKILGHLDNC